MNSVEYRQRIKSKYREAIAGEMEIAPVYAAAVRRKVDWGLVKGISDWGFNKNDDFQRLAAEHAASFVVHAIRIGGLDPTESRLFG